MTDFSLLIKATAADCNLRCAYCFYAGRPLTEPHPRISDEILERMIASYLGTHQTSSYTFSWQGGEPGLMGAAFFRKVVRLQTKYARAGAVICNAFQTNGTLITNELAAVLAEYKFLCGVSLDGPADLHDGYRRTLTGGATHASVLRGIDRLRRHGVELNIITVVNDRTVKQPREIYGYFKNHGFVHQQYIPCVPADAAGHPLPHAISGPDWGRFLCAIFDRWIDEDTDRVSIRLFDSILQYLVSGKRNACAMGVDCRQYFVIEADGGVYPCDFFVREALRLGNVHDQSWKALLGSPLYREFGLQKSRWTEACNACPYLPLCQGDCPAFRASGDDRPSTSILCNGWKEFYAHALPPLERLASRIREGQR